MSFWFPAQFLDSHGIVLQMLGGSGDGSSCWIDATHVGHLDLVSSSHLQPGSTAAVAGIWEGNL